MSTIWLAPGHCLYQRADPQGNESAARLASDDNGYVGKIERSGTGIAKAGAFTVKARRNLSADILMMVLSSNSWNVSA